MKTARELDGVDRTRIVAIGASVGSDGAPDGCCLLNDEYENSCLGAMSLSPGSYLTIPYADAVRALGEETPAKPAWCLAATDDKPSAEACAAASGDHFRSFTYPGNPHGMMLVQPGLEPNVMLLMLDSLKLALGL